MKNIFYYTFLISLFFLCSCASDVNSQPTNIQSEEIVDERQSTNFWPSDDSNFYEALNSEDTQYILNYFKNKNNFVKYSDLNQKIFLQSVLISKITLDENFITETTNSYKVLDEIFKQNLPCQASIVRVVELQKKKGKELDKELDALLKENSDKIKLYLNDLLDLRKKDFDKAKYKGTDIFVENFETVLAEYLK